MIIIHSTYIVQPEKKAYAHQLMVHMANIALRTEACISYEFFSSLDQAEKILLTQEWHSLTDVENHYQSNPVRQLIKELPKVLANQVETRTFLNQSAHSNAEEKLNIYQTHSAYVHNNNTLH